jgi:thioredoxin reductase (NADPH)
MNRRRFLVASGVAGAIALVWLLSLHRSYSPGPVSKGHAHFESQCAACHEPWQGATNAGCLDCHGDMASNKHAGSKLADKDSGLLPGFHLAGLKGQLACLSCHTDHRGRVLNLADSAGVSCAQCHQHDSIADVSKHNKKPMERPSGSRHLFRQAYSHKKHFELLIKRDPALAEMQCKSCHGVEPPAKKGGAMRLVINWTGCAGSGCHDNPQDKYLKMPASAGVAPVVVAAWKPESVKHLNALFEHSPGHLKSECGFCHTDMKKSARVGDPASRRVANCFGCHAHQPTKALSTATASLFGVSDAFADEAAPSPAASSAPAAPASPAAAASTAGSPATASSEAAQASPGASPAAQAAASPPASAAAPIVPAASGAAEKKIVACTGCHAFHTYGTERTTDFPTRAPDVRPHSPPRLTVAMYVPAIVRGPGGPSGFSLRRVLINPWWMGLLAFVVTGTMLGTWVRAMPRLITEDRSIGNVAPQRGAEVPALDDTYQSSVPRLYVVGETAGTASINLAMRSGRQSIEFIANLLKFEKAQVAPEVYDVAIIGCGPAGISAGATAINKGLKYVALEKVTAASTIRNYPRGKFVQATAIDIAEYGSFFMEGDTSKEALVKEWEKIIAETGIKPNEREEVISVARRDGVLEIATDAKRTYKARFVVLAIGVRGSPRHLGLANETPDRVFYNLIEPEEYQNKKIMVVGGGNAGAEVAQALANPDLHNLVGYSFRTATLGPPVTPENAEKISNLQQKGLLTVYPASQLLEIKPGKIVLAPFGKPTGPELTAGAGAVVLTAPSEIENDFIFAMLGAELPTKFMKSVGIKMMKKGR